MTTLTYYLHRRIMYNKAVGMRKCIIHTSAIIIDSNPVSEFDSLHSKSSEPTMGQKAQSRTAEQDAPFLVTQLQFCSSCGIPFVVSVLASISRPFAISFGDILLFPRLSMCSKFYTNPVLQQRFILGKYKTHPKRLHYRLEQPETYFALHTEAHFLNEAIS